MPRSIAWNDRRQRSGGSARGWQTSGEGLAGGVDGLANGRSAGRRMPSCQAIPLKQHFAHIALIFSILKHSRGIDEALLKASRRIHNHELKFDCTDVAVSVKQVTRPKDAVASGA